MKSCNTKKMFLTSSNKQLEVISVNLCLYILQQYLDFERKYHDIFTIIKDRLGGFLAVVLVFFFFCF